MSDLVGNPEDRFSHNEAHLISVTPEGGVEFVCPDDRSVLDLINFRSVISCHLQN